VKIISFWAYTDGGLNIKAVDFRAPTLLVGLSGAGKSQLLSYLYETYQLLCGDPFSLPDGNYHLRFEHGRVSYEFYATVHEGVLENKRLATTSGQLPSQPLKIKEWSGFVLTAKDITEIRQDRAQKTLEPEQIQEIKGLYQMIFQNIADIQVEERRFKEADMDWMDASCLSDGMLKTLSYLTELVTAPSGSILLIDEFENGLGLNCLSPLLEEILARDDVQVILSSHHPYVINNIPADHWLIISRHQDTIMSRSAKELGIGLTRYDAFFELMNGLFHEEDF